MDYVRRPIVNNKCKKDISNLNNHITEIYDKINDYFVKFHLLNMRINSKHFDNILYWDQYVFKDNHFVNVFDVKAKSGKNTYIFHLFIKSKFNEVEIRFLFDNLLYVKNIKISDFEYVILEEILFFDTDTEFKFYVKADKDIQILAYSSYEIISVIDYDLMLENKKHIGFLQNQIFNLSKRIKLNHENISHYILKKKDS